MGAFIKEIIAKGLVPLTGEQFENYTQIQNVLILDTRHQTEFVKGYIPNSIFIGIDGSFISWVKSIIEDLNQAIIIIAKEGKEEKIITKLAEIGYDNILGYLEGGISAWQSAGKTIDSIESITAQEFEKRLNGNNLNVLDVRGSSEYEAEHVEVAKSFPLDLINKNIESLNSNDSYYLYSINGYRSVIASSIFKARGYGKVIDITNGMGGIYSTDIERTDFLYQYYLYG